MQIFVFEVISSYDLEEATKAAPEPLFRYTSSHAKRTAS